MSNSQLQDLVQTYFRGVDDEDIALALSTLSHDCRFSIETHGVVLNGHEEISGMFKRLWSSHKSVRHDKFHFVEDPVNSVIAARFRVTNQLPDGKLVYKSNCNFFTCADGVFTEVRVYMAGENTLNHKGKS